MILYLVLYVKRWKPLLEHVRRRLHHRRIQHPIPQIGQGVALGVNGDEEAVEEGTLVHGMALY